MSTCWLHPYLGGSSHTLLKTEVLVFESDQSSIETDSIEYTQEPTFTQKVEQRAAAEAPAPAVSKKKTIRKRGQIDVVGGTGRTLRKRNKK